MSIVTLELGKVELPKEVEWYEINGQLVFPLYAMSGGLACKYVTYLIKRGDAKCPFDGDMGREHGPVNRGNGWWTYCVEVPTLISPEERLEKLKEAVVEFTKAVTSWQ